MAPTKLPMMLGAASYPPGFSFPTGEAKGSGRPLYSTVLALERGNAINM